MYETLRLDPSPGVLRVTLHRPERRNAINATLLRELHQALDRAEAAPECRVVVLRGSGGVFSTGMDFAEAALPAGATPRDAARGGEAFMELLTRLASIPRVVVSAVDGLASGGGVGLAAASDFVLATERSQFALPEALWGLLPCCVLPFLARRTGFQKAYAMALSTTPVGARQAERIHLVDEVCDDPELPLRRLAARMARLDPATIGDLKAYARRLDGITEEVRRAALDEFGRLLASPTVQRRIGDFARDGVFPWEAAAPPAPSPRETKDGAAGAGGVFAHSPAEAALPPLALAPVAPRPALTAEPARWMEAAWAADREDAADTADRPDAADPVDTADPADAANPADPARPAVERAASIASAASARSGDAEREDGSATPAARGEDGAGGAPSIHRLSGAAGGRTRVAWLFPGQGAQRRGMGAGLFERYPALCDQADAVLGYSVRALCLDDPDGRLQRTEFAQPALFVVSALAGLARREEGGDPAFLAGHSLGEINALFAAGCFDFQTGVRLVHRRGALMARAGGGGMLAVVGLPAARVEEILAALGAPADLAGYNAPDQVTVSGPPQALQAVADAVRGQGARCVPLRVSAAFHSRWMEPAAAEFRHVLAEVSFAAPRLPVLSNATGTPHQAGAVAEGLARQLRAPVRWWDGMRYLLAQGVTEVEEIGPGGTLAGLWRAARQAAPPLFADIADAADVPAAAASASPARNRASLPFSAVTTPAPALPSTPDPSPSGGGASAAAPASLHRSSPRPGPGAVDGEEAYAGITAETLGSAEFRRDYGLRRAYLAGSMFKGIASAALVVRMARAGMMGYFGAGGVRLERVDEVIREIRGALGPDGRWGMNLLHSVANPRLEAETVELYLRHDVRFVEAAAYLQVTPPLVHFRFRGAHRDAQGRAVAPRRVLAKVSRPEIARLFLAPPPEALLRRLVDEGKLTPLEAGVARELPLSEELCVESDSGGHTDGGAALTLLPALLRLRDQAVASGTCPRPVRVGAAGGIGAPEAAAAAFLLGADFVLTGSVNQCSPQADTSDAVKDILAGLDVHDTAYAPAGDLFELGARVQVVRKGTLFPAQANRLYELYRRHASLDEVDPAVRAALERTCFLRPLDEAWRETRAYLARENPAELERAERDPRQRMAQVFRWYFVHTARAARRGDPQGAARYQIHCGPAMGAFNRFVRGTALEPWRERHVDRIADALMQGAAAFLRRRLRALAAGGAPDLPTPDPLPGAPK